MPHLESKEIQRSVFAKVQPKCYPRRPSAALDASWQSVTASFRPDSNRADNQETAFQGAHAPEHSHCLVPALFQPPTVRDCHQTPQIADICLSSTYMSWGKYLHLSDVERQPPYLKNLIAMLTYKIAVRTKEDVWGIH
ncbi:hypothetical protein H1C71_033804 [Ictidomys tridecemlineatus]|nr:hypothetical protein H1C71_033804 [Ictidomys tridecemlineatus]